MNKYLLALCFGAALSFNSYAQQSGPRLFLDIPDIHVMTPDVKNIAHRVGLGGSIAMNVGTHWSDARLGIGANVTGDPKSNDLKSTINTTPYGLLEVGLGKYRSNGDRCAKSFSSAFTAMAKAGIRYYLDTRKSTPGQELDKTGYGFDYTVGAELGYFYIRDVFKNMEVVLDGNYHTQAKVISVNFGFKLFLNLKAERPY